MKKSIKLLLLSYLLTAIGYTTSAQVCPPCESICEMDPASTYTSITWTAADLYDTDNLGFGIPNMMELYYGTDPNDGFDDTDFPYDQFVPGTSITIFQMVTSYQKNPIVPNCDNWCNPALGIADPDPECSVAMPVELLYFKALLTDKSLLTVSWKTAMEQNVASFNIEYSIDGIHFSTLQTYLAQGAGAYHFSLPIPTLMPNVQKIFLRLNTLDYDQSIAYSSVVAVGLFLPKQGNNIIVWGNPVNDILRLSTYAPASIYDRNGKVVKSFHTALIRQDIDVADLPSGIYFIRSQDGAIARFVKQ
jgi:hypothetical protein